MCDQYICLVGELVAFYRVYSVEIVTNKGDTYVGIRDENWFTSASKNGQIATYMRPRAHLEVEETLNDIMGAIWRVGYVCGTDPDEPHAISLQFHFDNTAFSTGKKIIDYVPLADYPADTFAAGIRPFTLIDGVLHGGYD